MTEQQAMFDLIGVLARRRYQAAERSFARIGLNHTEARLLRLIDQAAGEVDQEALSSQVYIDRSNVGRALKQLEASGYIERAKSADDKRRNRTRLTAKGAAAVLEIAKLRAEMIEDFCRGISAEEAAVAVRILAKVASNEDIV